MGRWEFLLSRDDRKIWFRQIGGGRGGPFEGGLNVFLSFCLYGFRSVLIRKEFGVLCVSPLQLWSAFSLEDQEAFNLPDCRSKESLCLRRAPPLVGWVSLLLKNHFSL